LSNFEDYADKMPYQFTGMLERLVVILETGNLTEAEKERLRRLRSMWSRIGLSFAVFKKAEQSFKTALQDVQCPRCNGHGRPRIIELPQHPPT
jgi:hypothetical protein